MINSKKPGKLGEINLRIPVTVGALGLTASILFTSLFHIFTEEQRKPLVFLTTLLGTSAGITSAFYVGQSIKLNAESKKLDTTTSYISRWSNPSFDSTRKAVYQVQEKLKGKEAQEHSEIIQKELDSNLDLRLSIIDALNFLEEVALCVEIGIINEDVTYKYYRSIVRTYCETFNLWIGKLRHDKENTELFKKLTDLGARWKALKYEEKSN